ncbi:hypothetical protein ACJRO7_033576 [Eucalyptus globulus]|uniref:Uncharacterized protein n=1 Tax=Eucalyptus globulus TaxID=34317 RepID=A0ABD3JPT9_EUCGL
MQEAMKEKESAVKRQEPPLCPPRRGRIKRLVFTSLFRCFKALVGQTSGFLLGPTATCTPTSNHKSPPLYSLPCWGCGKESS